MARILHIEDDPANRLLVRKLLAAKGFEVLDAADGLEGIRMACAERPDLILVDINVPHLDGYEVTLRLRGEPSLQGVPIVAITAEGDRDTSLAVGCDGFLQKPIDARTFASTVSGYLKGKRESTHPQANNERLRQQSQKIVAHLEEKVAELSAANARLREVDRARTAFYRNISHELATPMTPIVGYLKMLIDGELGPVTRSQDKAMRAMDDCVRRLRALIDNLLDVTGLETGRMKFFVRDYDVGEVVRRAVETSKIALDNHGHAITVEIPQGALPAAGDADRLCRAVGQLLDNAIKFTPDGGAVGVRVKPVGSRYEIVVADTGPGVPPERAEAIFEPFYQVDASPTRQHGGVGVGLAIVRRVAQGFMGDVKLLPPGNTPIGGRDFGGARFALTIAKRVAPSDGLALPSYLDHNATTPPCDEALSAMARASREGWANPSSLHGAGRAARRLVDDARDRVAALAGMSARDVVFTSGGTEANNLGLARVFPSGTGVLITSRLEHPSVLSFADELSRRGVRVELVEPLRSGHLDPGSIERALSSRKPGEPALVAVHAVHHETGAVQPVAAIVALAHRLGAEVHVDAVQAAGRVEPSLWRGGDTVALAAHKLRGPKGIGAVVSRPGANVRPILRGGSQERGLRPGTVDPVAASGFGAAAARALEGGPARYQALGPLRDRAERSLIEAGEAAGVKVEVTAGEPRAPHVAHLLVEGFRGDELVAALDLEGVYVSSGSACSAGTAEPSPAIAALVGPERASFSLRVSLGETTTAADIEALERAFARVVFRR